MKIKNEQVIDLNEWDELVVKTYGRPYSFQQQDGCQSRGRFKFSVPDAAEDFEAETIPEKVNGEEMGVSFAAWLKRDPKQHLNIKDDGVGKEQWGIDLWWHRNFYPNIQMVANDLHAKGLLEKGKYTIDIDW